MTLYAFCLAPSLFYSMHLLEESPERLWDGGVQLKKSTSVFCQYISVQSSPVYSTLSHQWGWYLTFTWHCKVSSSLNSESSGRNTHSKTVTSKFYPIYFSCLFFHPFKHGWLWKSKKNILLFRSEYTAYILFSVEYELYPTLTVSISIKSIDVLACKSHTR